MLSPALPALGHPIIVPTHCIFLCAFPIKHKKLQTKFYSHICITGTLQDLFSFLLLPVYLNERERAPIYLLTLQMAATMELDQPKARIQELHPGLLYW